MDCHRKTAVTLQLDCTAACTDSDVSSSWVTKLKDLSLLIDTNITPWDEVLVKCWTSQWNKLELKESAWSRDSTSIMNVSASSLPILQRKFWPWHVSRPNKGLASLIFQTFWFCPVYVWTWEWRADRVHSTCMPNSGSSWKKEVSIITNDFTVKVLKVMKLRKQRILEICGIQKIAT